MPDHAETQLGISFYPHTNQHHSVTATNPEISPEIQSTKTKKRHEAKHWGEKNLPESICATSVQWKLQLNKSHWESTTGQTALEKCIDNSTLMCVLNQVE